MYLFLRKYFNILKVIILDGSMPETTLTKQKRIMNKVLLLVSFVCICGFASAQNGVTTNSTTKATKISQNNNTVQTNNSNSSKLIDVKTKPVVTDENTNDPLTNGYQKTMVNGKEIYIKNSPNIIMTYDPNK